MRASKKRTDEEYELQSAALNLVSLLSSDVVPDSSNGTADSWKTPSESTPNPYHKYDVDCCIFLDGVDTESKGRS